MGRDEEFQFILDAINECVPRLAKEFLEILLEVDTKITLMEDDEMGTLFPWEQRKRKP